MADDSMALGYALGQDSNCNNNCGNGWGGFGEGLWAVIILAMIFNGGFGFGSWGGGWQRPSRPENSGGSASLSSECRPGSWVWRIPENGC